MIALNSIIPVTAKSLKNLVNKMVIKCCLRRKSAKNYENQTPKNADETGKTKELEKLRKHHSNSRRLLH